MGKEVEKRPKAERHPAEGLSAIERQVAELHVAGGTSFRKAFLEVIGSDAAEQYTAVQLRSAVNALTRKVRPYVQAMVAEAAERATVSREALIEQAHLDREYAISEGNPAAAVAATKLIAQLSGVVAGNGANPGSGGMGDAVALLDAVERLSRARAGGDAIDVTPD